MSLSDRWARTWPALLAILTVSAVGLPAAIASYRHARTVVERSGDPVMAPWLPLSVDGMLLAALVVIWVRRHRGERSGVFPWVSFGVGMVVTIAANLAAAQPTGEGYVVALWPPLALAITLELVALVAYRRTVPVTVTAAAPTPVTAPEPVPAPAPVTVTAEPARPVTGQLDPPTEVLPAVTTGQPVTGQPEVTGAGHDDVPAPVMPAPDQRKHLRPVGGPAAGKTDEQLLADLQKWTDEIGSVPSHKLIMDRYRIGRGRCDRLREQVRVPARRAAG